MKHQKLILGLVLVATALIAQVIVVKGTSARKQAPTKFTVRIENTSDPAGQVATNGVRWPFALSPGMFVLDSKNQIFTEGRPARPNGLEAQAEDGNPAGLVSSLERMHHAASLHGVFNTPIGAKSPGPIGPGGSYEFTFTATPKMKLYLTLMFGQSNDLFYAPGDDGIVLFDGKGNPATGDVTDQLLLWDAGTEINEEEGIGPNQAPRQSMANTGPAEHGVVHRATNVRFYGKNDQLFRVTVSAEGGM